MIPRRIHRIWLGDPMPPEFEEFGARWRALHPTWEVRDWTGDDLDWLENRRAFDDAPFFSSKANIARYEIINRYGGLYVDCDVEPLRPVDDLLEGEDLVVSEEFPGYFGNEFFAAAAGHPVLQRAVAEVSDSHFARPTAKSPARTGPEFWTRCVGRTCQELGIAPRVLPREAIYPYAWSQPHLRNSDFPQAWAVHHWAKSWVPNTGSGSGSQDSLRRAVRRGLASSKTAMVRAKGWWDRIEPVSRPPHHATYLGENRLFVRTSEGFPIIALCDDAEVTPSLIMSGTHDPQFGQLITRELQTGGVFVEVGARSGLNAIRAAQRVGDTGRVFEFVRAPVCGLVETTIAVNRHFGLEAETNVIRIADQDDADAALDTLDEQLIALAEINLLRVSRARDAAPVVAGLQQTIADGRLRLLDIDLHDAEAGPGWRTMVERLRQIVADPRVTTWTLDREGRRIPCSLDAAVHSNRQLHFLVAFAP